jgi:flavin reductase (DIM6/NTAB) family NADH-FMN oxidoreductase RutF
VTTVTRDRHPHGVTVGSLCSLSLDPQLVMFSLYRRGRSHEVFAEARRFVVNVLNEDQESLARRFATSRIDRFAGLPALTQGAHGLPVVPDALVTVLCTRYRVVRAGDHGIVVGLVHETELRQGHPLLYCDRRYRRVLTDDRHNAVPVLPT